MKRHLFYTFILITTLASCSKKGNTGPGNTVVINGGTYPTVVIGGQTWTAANYNGTGGENYDNSTTNIAANGKLYTITEAYAIALPAGWRMPTENDFNKLQAAQGVKQNADGTYAGSGSNIGNLMAQSGWLSNDGTNRSGFNAIATGYYVQSLHSGAGGFDQLGKISIMHSSTFYNNDHNIPECFTIQDYNKDIAAFVSSFVMSPNDRAVIRFVKDN